MCFIQDWNIESQNIYNSTSSMHVKKMNKTVKVKIKDVLKRQILFTIKWRIE
jgi:hypothetical protein